MVQDKYVTVRIPRGLADEIDEILRSGLHGYGSRAELVKEAVRLRLEALTRNRSIRSKTRFKEEK